MQSLPLNETPTILIVDDDPDFAATAALMVRHLGFSATVAGNGAAALEAIEDSLPAIILLDLFMPGMDGMALLRRLRQAAIHVPVVVASGAVYATDPDPLATGATALGADAVIRKPFSLGELRELLRKVVPGLVSAAEAAGRTPWSTVAD